MAEPLYVIRRESSEPATNPGDVYVTGPEFGSPAITGIYSSTRKAANATRYTAKEVGDLLNRGKWKHDKPRVIPAEDAGDLEEDAKGGES